MSALMLVRDMKKSQNIKNLGINNGYPPAVVHLYADFKKTTNNLWMTLKDTCSYII